MFEELLEEIKRDEGFVPHAYQDHLGYWTIGYGCLIDERRGGKIPDHIAEQWLAYNVNQKMAGLDKALPWLVSQPEDVRRALVNMAYQMGVQGVLGFPSMLKALESGDRKAAAEHALDSKWAREQTPVRASRVATLIRG